MGWLWSTSVRVFLEVAQQTVFTVSLSAHQLDALIAIGQESVSTATGPSPALIPWPWQALIRQGRLSLKGQQQIIITKQNKWVFGPKWINRLVNVYGHVQPPLLFQRGATLFVFHNSSIEKGWRGSSPRHWMDACIRKRQCTTYVKVRYNPSFKLHGKFQTSCTGWPRRLWSSAWPCVQLYAHK